MNFSRSQLNTARIVLLTSLFWVFVDVFIISYFTDCSMYCAQQALEKRAVSALHGGGHRDKHYTGPAAKEIDDGPIDYDTMLKKRNERLAKMNKRKGKQADEDAYRNFDEGRYIGETKKDAQVDFLYKMNGWFKEASEGERKNPDSWPGENGRGVVIPPSLKKLSEKRFKENQFNILASDLMALNRSVPDQRSSACKNREYRTDLPTTSIIIVYHNEGNSTLLRGLVSIIRMSPHRYLKEIILVDDASEDREYLHKPLDEFVKTLDVPVKIFRNEKRLGLMKSRIVGADAATGDTMTFLDAHIECTRGWLVPLLAEIKMNNKAVVCPVIDVVSDDTFEYLTGSELTYGGFDKRFTFDWIPVPERENGRRGQDRSQPLRYAVVSPIIDVISDVDFAYLQGAETTYGGFNEKMNFRWNEIPEREHIRRSWDKSLPARTPTMAGGLFTIDRNYFYELGTYDEGMDIWGAENLEMSFRVWMCGGTLLILPCSHVGHVFRKQTPYSFPGGTNKIIFRNNRRLIDVWTDEYKEYFHKMIPDLMTVEAGDISPRVELRNKLHCKTFRWYLENIYPESPLPLDFYHVGSITNEATNFCIDTMGRKMNEDAGASMCHGQGGNQLFEFSKSHQIKVGTQCLDTKGNPGAVKIVDCNLNTRSQQWDYDNMKQLFTNRQSTTCLAINDRNNKILITKNCEEGDKYMKWYFKDSFFPAR